jgi:hypothetical protein
MSAEDALAREAVVSHLDGHTPMALEVPAPKKRQPKQDAEAKAKAKAAVAAAKEAAKAERKAAQAAAREQRAILAAEARARRAAERLEAIAAAKRAKIDEAAEGYCDLPAVVLRDGTVKHIDGVTCVEVIDKYLGALGVDVEHSGYDVGDKRYELRTVQLGGKEMTVVLDPADERQAAIIKWALGAAEKLHAFAAVADLIPLVLAGFTDWESAWGKMFDGVLYVKLTDPRLAGSEANGLKDLSRDLLREYAVSPAAEKDKNALFKAIGCNINTDSSTPAEKNGWNMVDKRAVVMIRYAGSDVLDLAAVLEALPSLPVSQEVLTRERECQALCARVALDGFALDHAHITAKIEEHEASKAEHRSNVEILTGGKIVNPSAPGAGAALIELWPHLASVLDRSEDTGEPSAAKKSLAKIQGDGIEWITAQEILAYRHDVTTLSLLLRPLESLCVNGDSRMRPTVYTINADTGRMSCVRPNGQQFCYTSAMDILTDQGWKAFPEVDGSERVAQWSAGIIEFVTPEAIIHQPYDGPMIRISGEHHEQVVTPNHRVYSKTRDGKLMIERADSWLKHGSVEKIVDRKFIRAGRLAGRKLTDTERLSLYRAVAVQADGHFRDDCLFVSLKVTKARKVSRARELGLEVRQTPNQAGGKDVFEAKAYAADCEPWLNLPAKTFNIPALLELDSEELSAFLSEVMLWDGDSTRKESYNQAMTRSEAVDAVELAAVLSGNSTCRSIKRVAGQDYANVQVCPKAERHASRTNVEEVPSDGMIHCVTVPSGAIVVRCNGKVIVSGNSRRGGIRACVIAGWMDIKIIDGKWEVVR